MSTQGEFFELPKPVRQEAAEDGKTATSTATGTAHSSQNPLKRGLKDLSIPKLYYSISEVSRITGLEQYVLRYWETEFDELRPQKNRAGNRIYSNKDIKFILKIKELLREKRYTIEGAKQILKEEMANDRELEKMDIAAEANGQSAQASAQAFAQDPGQITIDEASKKPAIKIERAAIDEMRQSVKTLRDLLKRK